ncbi:energy-coupling factor transporter transmembrane component T ['Camptotheca acuminata' phytoplasma]|uniref:energy-coupling factor transporter transmembrane component T n=1 Tax='Camptotheca acuminata' phytoplasma TaxID=3239192 RepID=UPI00351A959A
MEIVNRRYDSNKNAKSFVHSIHPCLKIVLIILIFKIIFSLKSQHFNAFFEFGTSLQPTLKVIFCLVYFLFFTFIFFFLFKIVGYSFGKLIKQIAGFKFIFFFSFLLRLSTEAPSNNVLSYDFWIWDIGHAYLYILLFISLYLFSLFVLKKKNYRRIYFLFLFVFFCILPSFYRSKSYPVYIQKTDLFNIFLIFISLFLFLMINILMKEINSFVEINDGLEMFLKPLKKIKVPVEIITLMLSMIFMSIPFLLEETKKIFKAQLSRGLNFYTNNIFKKIYYLLSLLIPIFVLSFKKSFVLSNAMETRGFVLGKERTKLVSYRMKKNDYFILFFFLFFFILSFF